jgi:hypothetical protein
MILGLTPPSDGSLTVRGRLQNEAADRRRRRSSPAHDRRQASPEYLPRDMTILNPRHARFSQFFGSMPAPRDAQAVPRH